MNRKRMEREKKTIGRMIKLYCGGKHGSKKALCPQCADLLSYAAQRIEKCPHGDNKPTCARCTIHCYKPSMREQVRLVMKYAGPRMIFLHPVAAISHCINGLRRSRKSFLL